MNLSDLEYREEMKAPSIDTADATQTLDTLSKLHEYKSLFIFKFGDAEIRVRENEIIIIECERFDNWQTDCLMRKYNAMQGKLY